MLLRHVRCGCVGLRHTCCKQRQHHRATARRQECISRESNPGHIDGNDVFCHQTTDAL